MTAPAFNSEEILAEATKIARIPAPPGFESTRAAAVADLVRAAGWRARLDEVGNVVTSANDGDSGDATWVLIHLDTVFGRDVPLDFVHQGAVAKGPGIGDNAVALAAGLALIRSFEPHPGAGDLIVAFTVGEESHGNLRGARHLLDHGGASKARAIIAVEGHRGDELGIEMVGSVRFRLSLTAGGGHSWWDRGRPSAVHELIQFSDELLVQTREVCPDVAVNIGTISGGSGVTAIAARAEAVFEGRASNDSVLASFEGVVQELVAHLAVPYALTEIGRRPGGVLAPEHWLVAQAQRARHLAGLPEAPFGSSSSDANPFASVGIPAVTFGITTGRNAHQLDEEIDVAPIAAGTSALSRLVHLLCDGDAVRG